MIQNIIEVSAEQLIQERASGETQLLLDVREEFEWQIVHIPDCLLIPMNKLPTHLSALDTNRAIVVLCAHGHRSLYAIQYLQSCGFTKLRNLTGGMAAWQRANGDVETGQ